MLIGVCAYLVVGVCLPSADRGRPDLDPERVPHGADPGVQATVGQPLHVGFGIYYLREASPRGCSCA